MGRVAAIGCIVCRNNGYTDTPSEIHHIRAGQGMAQRAKHTEVLPLCPFHHRIGGHGNAIHAGIETWQKTHGTELKLLDQVQSLLKGAHC